MLVHHLKGLDSSTLANMVYMEQRRNKWPGLAEEVAQICAALEIEDANITVMSKMSYIQEHCGKGLQEEG